MGDNILTKKPRRFYALMIVLLVAYVIITLVVPPTAETLKTYNISLAKAYFFIVTLDILFAIIWMLAAYGFVNLLEYSKLIMKTKDGRAMQLIAWGLGFIAFRQPVTSLLTNIMNAIDSSPGSADTRVIVVNYISVVVAVVGFYLINLGADQLLQLTRKKPTNNSRMAFRLLSLALVTAYTFLAIGQGDPSTVASSTTRANFYLPNWLIVSTIIIPYAYAWYLAFTASYNIIFYSRNVKGLLYKKALHWLAWGINLIIINTIVLQFISAQGARLNKLNLGALLIIFYILIISIGVGFATVAAGAKKLRRIEEI